MIQELLAGSSERCLHPSFLLEGCEGIGMVPTAPQGGGCQPAWAVIWAGLGAQHPGSTLQLQESFSGMGLVLQLPSQLLVRPRGAQRELTGSTQVAAGRCWEMMPPTRQLPTPDAQHRAGGD